MKWIKWQPLALQISTFHCRWMGMRWILLCWSTAIYRLYNMHGYVLKKHGCICEIRIQYCLLQGFSFRTTSSHCYIGAPTSLEQSSFNWWSPAVVAREEVFSSFKWPSWSPALIAGVLSLKWPGDWGGCSACFRVHFLHSFLWLPTVHASFWHSTPQYLACMRGRKNL